MKKLVSLMIVVAMCLAIVIPVAAADFVPSISYKDHPDLVGDPVITPVEPSAEELDILITPVADAINRDPEDRNEAERELIELYEDLAGGDMKLPLPEDGKNYVIRDLIDISLIIKNDDPNADPEITDTDARVVLTFDLGVDADDVVLVYVYDNGWIEVENVVNNGDGSITVTLDKLGALAFCVEGEAVTPPSPTFDNMSRELITWIVLMVASSCAAVIMLAVRRKENR